jgi:hypothetical protein
MTNSTPERSQAAAPAAAAVVTPNPPAKGDPPASGSTTQQKDAAPPKPLPSVDLSTVPQHSIPGDGVVWTLLGFITLGIGFALVAAFAAPSNTGFAGGAAVLSVITAGAIAIERALEVCWTIVGATAGAWWPLNVLGKQIDSLTASVNAQVKPVFDVVEQELPKLKTDLSWTDTQMTAAQDEVTAMKQRLQELHQLAPGSQKVDMLTTAAFQNLSYLEKKYATLGLKDKIATAEQALAGVQDFTATFKDNPGRRLISIWAGSLIGLGAASVLGLDVFQAVAGGGGATSGVFPHLPVALTGLLMGLGSNPTHEAIRALQEIKKSQKLDNAPAPQAEGGNEGGKPAPTAAFTPPPAAGAEAMPIKTMQLRRH